MVAFLVVIAGGWGWLFRNIETGQDQQLTPDEIQQYVSQSTQDVGQQSVSYKSR
ncbi:hypothetical protein [Leuconostoc lactis]|uniref:hypothetical protein n=1 Tax=Leuconostoc lactis TaxID=1246 RepID=UPI00289F238F|nr:hypothetical protein [Leuconostoc lactis]